MKKFWNLLLALAAFALILERGYRAYQTYQNRYVCIERFDMNE